MNSEYAKSKYIVDIIYDTIATVILARSLRQKISQLHLTAIENSPCTKWF